MEQRLESGGFWSAVLELVSSHPYLCKRVAALQEFHQPGSTVPVHRNVLAYPLAPIFGLAAAGTGGGAAGLLVMVALVGIIAAIAIPSLLRARVSANEAATIGDMRSLISAQSAYFGASGGVFGKKECLLDPSACLRSYRGPAFLDPSVASAESHGYRRTLFLGRRDRSFAYVAVPIKPGQTGTRGFCADARGTICATRDGSAPGVVAGECDLSNCAIIR
jgi:type II secretory pathway pseudopilin PulG